ncbi:LANO_0G12948g1_1 [Lachancea nothofagi CBS 11611]|uniref:LANO_0G12948g1_1 n=1 Tax=Lachancea nothofagi CBS 11611 TaxID=1266666 RepID=A0A1G4KJY4_9SACH|nr:LANO_0G12948g1_1 [Lachancea nothofagi CBS 11611]
MPKQVVAALQVGTLPGGTQATLDHILSYADEIKKNNVSLLVIPEATLGGYPKGSNFGTYLGYRLDSGREEYARYHAQAIGIGAGEKYPEINKLCQLSKTTGAFICCGCVERDGTTLYCTIAYIDPNVGYVGKHRKLTPTATERLVWGQGDGSTLNVFDTKVGKVGGAICWENMMPLLRQAMYSKGVEVWVAPTVDQRPIWRSVMQNLAYEGRLFVVSAVQLMTNATEMGLGVVADESTGQRKLPGLEPTDDNCINGGSMIVNPYGEIIAGPLIGEEGLLCAEIDTDMIVKARYDFDLAGHYSRGDVFQLQVNEVSQDVKFSS